MDKSKAIERLNALEKETAELRKIIEPPEPAPSLLTKPRPGSRQAYWEFKSGSFGVLTSNQLAALTSATTQYYDHGNLFQSEELAQAYAEAIDTMLLLRHQPGTVAPTGDWQWILSVDRSLAKCITFGDDNKFRKIERAAPCFATEEDAQRAIETIGEERILRMFKTLHHTV